MALQIKTNVAALTAHKNSVGTQKQLDTSIERLSSGLRINRAADDASGMAIADSLRAQSLGIGQAIRNANDGISIIQIADAALSEVTDILATIKSKAIQAAQDGQSSESRSAIQADIKKLTEEVDRIATTTSFNNQKLLSGNFSNRSLQIGAYSGEKTNISIGSTEAAKIGHINTSDLTIADDKVGLVKLAIYSPTMGRTYALDSVDVQFANDPEKSLGAVADSINRMSDILGIQAEAQVTTTTSIPVAAGTIEDDFQINGIPVGTGVTVAENDSTGALVSAINSQTANHGVVASVKAGYLTLTSNDGRPIQLYAPSITSNENTGINKILGKTNMSTLGKIRIVQQGASRVRISNIGSSNAISFNSSPLELGADCTMTESSSIISANSIIKSGSEFTAGWVTGNTLAVKTITSGTSGTIVTQLDSIFKSGSVISSGSIIMPNSTLGGDATISGNITNVLGTIATDTTINKGCVLGSGTVLGGNYTTSGGNLTISKGTGTLSQGSVLKSGSTLTGNTVIPDGMSITLQGSSSTVTIVGNGSTVLSDLDTTANTTWTTKGDVYVNTTKDLGLYETCNLILASGSVIKGGSTLNMNSKLDQTAITVGNAFKLNQNMTLTGASTIVSGQTLKIGSVLTNKEMTLKSSCTLSKDMTLQAGTRLKVATSAKIAAGSTVGGTIKTISSITVNSGAQFTLQKSSKLTEGTWLQNGSTIGGNVTLANSEQISVANSTIGAGSTLKTGTIISKGTYLESDVYAKIKGSDDANDIRLFKAGTQLNFAIELTKDTTLERRQVLAQGSVIMKGSVLAASDNSYETTETKLSEGTVYRLNQISVMTEADAQNAIAVADAAIRDINKIRADLGSVQQQLNYTTANLSNAAVNISAAESTIRDLDFAEEASNYSTLNIIIQSSMYALKQANTSSQAVLQLLQ